VAAGRVLAAAWLERGEQSPFIRTARRGIPTTVGLKEEVMFVIGIDPHKRSHTAAVLDDTEALVGQLCVNADQLQATLALCLVVVLAWIAWGSFRGHEQRCLHAVTVGQHKTGYQEVPCNTPPQEQFQYLRDHPDDFRPGTPTSN
jgi:hypothetical protein